MTLSPKGPSTSLQAAVPLAVVLPRPDPVVDSGQVATPDASIDGSPTAPPSGPETEAPATEPLDESTMVEDGSDSAASDTATVGQDTGATGAQLEGIAREQRELINQDSLVSETQVTEVATANRKEVGKEFGGVRRGLSALFTQTSAGVQSFITGKQAEVRAASVGILKSAQTLVSGTVQAGEAHGNQVRDTINGFVEGVSASLQGQVQVTARQITGAINGVSLPAIPGVAQLRAAAGGFVNRAAGAVTSGLGQVRGLISSTLRTGTQLLSSLLAEFGRTANSALTQVANGIQRGVQAIGQSLGRIANTVLGALRKVLSDTMLPMVSRLEGRLTQAISKTQKQTVAAIRTNRDQHLQALAAATSASSGATAVGEGSGAARSAAGDTAALQAIGQEAVRNNRTIVQTFQQRTSDILDSVFHALTEGAARIVQHISGVIAQVTSAVLGKIQEIMRGFGQIADAVGNFMQSLLRDLGSVIADVAQSVRAMVQHPVDQLLQFAGGALSRTIQFVGRFVRNLLSGNIGVPSVSDVIGNFRPTPLRGPITKPRPPGGPITLPGLRQILVLLAVIGALVLYAVPQLAVIVSALIALGFSPAGALIILGIVAILALIALLLLLYLLYKFLKSRPKPPEQPEPTITHETDFSAPNGSPKSRREVGVGEKVTFTGSAAGTWTASTGSPRTGTGTTFTWTAPERVATADITLRVGSKSATASLGVLEPDSITGIKLSENIYPKGQQGAGMLLNFSFNPQKVSFGNTESREVSGPASDIKGYYLKHGMPHDHNAGPIKFFRIGEDNKFVSARDRATQSGYPPPWDDGSFHWKIPNKYRVITETGDGEEYTVVKQEFTIEGPSGKTKITKAGEEVERTP